MSKHPHIVGSALLLCLWAAQPGRASVVIDNTNGLAVQASGGYTISPFGGPGQWIGTTFRTGPTQTSISRLTANLGTTLTQNTYDLALYAAGSDLLPDQLLASVLIDLPPFQSPGVYSAYSGDALGSIADVILNPNSAYALVVRSFGSDITSSFGGWNQYPVFPNCCNLTYSAFDGFAQLNTIGNDDGTWVNLFPSGDILYQLEVTSVSSSVPAPMPIFGAVMAWSRSRHIRKKIKNKQLPV